MRKKRSTQAKAYLEGIRRIQIQSRQQKRMLKELRETAAAISSPSFSADRVQSSGSGSGAKFEQKVESIVEIESDLKDSMQQITEALNLLRRMDNPAYSELLELRYIYNKSWKSVSKQMDEDGLYYSDRYVRFNMHTKALADFEKILRSSTK